MRGSEDVEALAAAAEKLLQHPAMKGPRNAFLLAAAALRIAGDHKLADQVEARGLDCPVTPPPVISRPIDDEEDEEW